MDLETLRGRQLDSMVRELVADSGAHSAFIVLEDGRVIAAAGDFKTQIVLVPDRSVVAMGPVATRSASGELIAFAGFGEGFIGAVFPAELDERAAVAALAQASQRSPLVH